MIRSVRIHQPVLPVRFVLSLLVALIGLGSNISAYPHDGDDRRPLEHKDYDRWNSIGGSSLSNDGDWVMYSVQNGKDESTLKIRSAKTDREYTVEFGAGGRISYDSKYAAYRIQPDPELIKKLTKENKKAEGSKKELPKSQFEILNLESGRHWTMTGVGSFSMPAENGNWIAYLLEAEKEANTVKKDSSKVSESYEVTPEGLKRAEKGSSKKEKKQEPASKASKSKPKAIEKKSEKKSSPKTKSGKPKKKSAGTTLVLHNLETHQERRFPNVVSFTFSKDGSVLAMATSAKDDADADGVSVLDLERDELKQILNGLGNYKGLSFNEDGSQLAFLSDRDDYDAKDPSWSLYLWRKSRKEAAMVAAEGKNGIPEGWWLSSSGTPLFAENGKRLFFNTMPKPKDANKEDDDDKEPTAKLDIWHWQDPLLQPQQLLQKEQEKRRSYRASYNLRSKKIAQLASKEIPSVQVDPRRKSDVALAVTQEKYKKIISWDFPGFRDVYSVNLKTGKSTLLVEKTRGDAQMSPDGKFVIWWDTETQHWFSIPTNDEDAKPKKISDGIETSLANELHDTPSEPRPYGVAGWLTDDNAVFVYDRFDIWQLDPSGEQSPQNLTAGKGREDTIRFRILRLDREQRAFDKEQPWMLSAFNETSKASGFFRFDYPTSETSKKSDKETEEKSAGPLTQLIMLDEQLARLSKAKNSDAVIFTRNTFRRCPDLWYSSTSLKKINRISRTNPQQHEYSWGTAEKMTWTATDGQELDGLLYKPDDFDESNKYPLMVYFYERNSDNLHRYYAPAAGRSIINFSFYVSRGYVLFVPDIPYKTGEPGPSAANAILPGVEHLVKQGFIDDQRIGMQGHSWGGYQTAYLVTQTDMFACAESGAPVSNMTSAYGGIRWSSGMSRMFQYERTQSRIGETLWDAREKYIANSPLFAADKINTPLLILHNDKDGAVPWYQGIEMFVALRRLEKPAWLLNYNGDPHWVMGQENRRDFARRMQQFFDHYLMDGPLPKWMDKGIPAVDKGEDFGFETVEKKAEEPNEAEEGKPEPAKEMNGKGEAAEKKGGGEADTPSHLSSGRNSSRAVSIDDVSHQIAGENHSEQMRKMPIDLMGEFLLLSKHEKGTLHYPIKTKIKKTPIQI